MPLFKPTRPDFHDPREHEMREIVVVYLPDRLEAETAGLEAALTEICQQSGLGFSGSTEQEGTETALYFYGPLAQPLYAALKPTLLAHAEAANARIVLATGFRETRQYIEFPLHFTDSLSATSAAARSQL